MEEIDYVVTDYNDEVERRPVEVKSGLAVELAVDDGQWLKLWW